MKYRKIGLRMCIISIIMITLCIPNQIQIAKAAEGNSEVSFKVWDDEGEWTENGTNRLDVFPEKKNGNKWNVEPGSHDEYTFYVENNLGYKATCEIRLEAKVSKRTDLDKTDTTYPIKFQLYKRENDDLTKLLGSTGKNPLDIPGKTITHTETLNNGETCEYVLSWLFEEVDSTFNGGNYDFTLKVNAKQSTDSDNNKPTDPDNPNNPDKPDNPDNPDTPDNPDNPSKPDNPNKPSDDNKGDDDNKKDNSKDNKGDNTNKGEDESKGNGSSDSNNQGNSSQESSNINNSTQNISSKGKRNIKSTDKKKVNTSDITTPVIYVALMILTLGLILLVKSRKEN